MQLITFPLTLLETSMITPNVKHFVARCAQDPAFNYTPGQFITIHFNKDEKVLKRSYSIANAPSGNNIIEFAAGFIEGGPGSELLFNLKPGDVFEVSGPFGRLILKEENPKRYIFAATSTGITPYRAMLDEFRVRLKSNPELKIVILQGVQYRKDVLYKNEFEIFAAEFSDQVIFMACLSRENKSTLFAGEFGGYVQDIFPKLNLDPEDDKVYLCGNPSMIDDAFQYLQSKNFTVHNIVREKYISR